MAAPRPPQPPNAHSSNTPLKKDTYEYEFHMQPLADDIVVRLKEWLRTRILKSSFCRYTARRTDEDGSATHQKEDWHGTPSSVEQV
ncbi:hypothetical protein C8F04DRAFT_1258607 [Mycena alexandri]|uniref:Uncharacterized protein n=1 Tax=Mycena alexandri TaxID=1745969 RepID=A0AAD6SXQ7_9AGAR|nr:hypothetical protein C8F04DRAFT_1258607 [Mycena alexandri]